MSLIKLENISKSYFDAGKKRVIFQNLNLEINNSESVLLLGNSGCGKSTLLQIIGLLQEPTSGKVIINNTDCTDKNIDKHTINNFLQNDIGFIYQFHHLFHDFTALENLLIPQIIKGVNRKTAEKQANDMLEKLNLSHRKDAMPNELSGGEKQRVAIARAIIKHPKIILADEPTGNLDNDMSAVVVKEMLKLVTENHITLLMVSHNRNFSQIFDRTFELNSNGLLQI